jgi:hypothetical protein
MSLKKTLEQLEACVWPHDDFGSHVVQRSQRLRKVPIGQLGVEDLRLLITQGIGLPFLVPLALDLLEAQPLVEGAYCRGDLLVSVLQLRDEFWRAYPELNNRVVELMMELRQLHDLLVSEVLPESPRFQYR